MKQNIEINVPDGYEAKFNEKEMKIEHVKKEFEYHTIKSFKDAAKFFFQNKGADEKTIWNNTLNLLEHIDKQLYNTLMLRVIIAACHGCHSIEEWMKMFKMDRERVHFPDNTYKHKKDLLSVGSATNHVYSPYVGLGNFYTPYSVFYANLQRTLLPCKTEEIADYIAKTFSDLIFAVNFEYTGAKLEK